VIVTCRNVTKTFEDRTVVRDLDLDVPAGQCFGLLGPNGAGKTTTLKMIYGVTAPTSGTIHVFGEDVSRDPRLVRRRLGVTLQENPLIEVLSTRDNLAVFGRYHLLDETQIAERTEQLLDFLDLRSHADLPVVALSGGFQRRVSIALSLMNDPELLILDEPTTGLDPAVRISLWSRVGELRAEGKTILLTTHYMEEAERLCDRLAILDEGRLLVEGAPKELILTHLARHTVELEQDPSRHAPLLDQLNGVKHLEAGRRLMLYASDGGALLDATKRAGADGDELYLRPTNLEDVFLSLTGTGLEGGA